jgi:hypothetical protein
MTSSTPSNEHSAEQVERADMSAAGSALLSIAMTASIAAVAGALGGLLYARSQDPPPQIQVLDMRRVVEAVAGDPTLDEASRRARAQEISSVVSRYIDEQASQGVIVLDGSAVLRAPERLYVEP